MACVHVLEIPSSNLDAHSIYGYLDDLHNRSIASYFFRIHALYTCMDFILDSETISRCAAGGCLTCMLNDQFIATVSGTLKWFSWFRTEWRPVGAAIMVEIAPRIAWWFEKVWVRIFLIRPVAQPHPSLQETKSIKHSCKKRFPHQIVRLWDN